MKVEDSDQFEGELDFDRDTLEDFWPRYTVWLNDEAVGLLYLKRNLYGLKLIMEHREIDND